jgi:MFS family permease
MAKFSEVLRNRDFFLLWLGQIISQIGDRLNQMALIGFITQRLPGNTLQLASLLSFTILPVFVIGPLAGAYVDRWDRRKTMYICDFLRGCLVLLIPLYLIDPKKSLLPVYLVVFLLFSIGRFFVPAKLAIIPELVLKEHILLANSLVNTTGMIAAIAGFGIGGIVVTVFGVKGGFYLDAISFLVSSLMIWSIRLKSSHSVDIVSLGKEIVEVIRKSVFTEIKEGIGYLINQKQMRAVIDVLFLVWAALGASYVVLIVFVQESLKSLTLDLGFLVMCLGAGLFLSSLVYGRLGKIDNCFKTIYVFLFTSGLALVAFVIILMGRPHFFTAALLSFIFGLTGAPIMTAVTALIHDISTEKMLGKVFSSIEIVMHLAFLLFMFLGSALAEFKAIGRQGVLIGVGIVFAFIGAIGFLRIQLKLIRHGNAG